MGQDNEGEMGTVRDEIRKKKDIKTRIELWSSAQEALAPTEMDSLQFYFYLHC